MAIAASTISAHVAAHAAAKPDAPLIAGAADLSLTYGAAQARSAQVARRLEAAGVRPGDRVAVIVPKAPDVLLVYLGCLRAGAVFLPINPAYTDDELRYLLDDADPALVICEPSRVGALGGRSWTGLDDLMARSLDERETFADVPEPEDLAAILYTSGTTGRPKGAMLSHQNLSANAQTLAEAWEFDAADVLLHALPVFHAHGLFVAVNTTLVAGSSLRWLPRFEVDRVVEELPAATVFMGVPTFYTRLLADKRLDRERTARMRLFVSGSAPLAPTTHEDFLRRTGHAILERYGMTETLMLTSNPVHGERKPGTVGPPLPGVSVRITGAEPAGSPGPVEVRGPSVFSGYWRRPELTQTEFSLDGWFRTGDIGTFDGDGYLVLAGRSKDLIITGGLNVYPKEVEDVLDNAPGVAESAVIGVSDRDFGEAVVAIVVVQPAVELDTGEVRDFARRHLASYKVPKRVLVVDTLPRNAMGKVEKAALRKRFGP
jgi:malonyl-CoA/methylmalonyl-CoA synthetase